MEILGIPGKLKPSSLESRWRAIMSRDFVSGGWSRTQILQGKITAWCPKQARPAILQWPLAGDNHTKSDGHLRRYSRQPKCHPATNMIYVFLLHPVHIREGKAGGGGGDPMGGGDSFIRSLSFTLTAFVSKKYYLFKLLLTSNFQSAPQPTPHHH